MKKKTIVFLFIFLGLCFIFTVTGRLFSNLTGNLLNFIEKGFSGFAGLNPLQLLVAIFSKNLIASLFVAFTSCYLYGIPIFIFLLINTAAIGALLSMYPGFVIALLPHGVIEIPAVSIALALGWHLWRRKERTWRKIHIQDVIYFLKTVVPLLFVAAVVEVYITPAVIARFIPLP